MAVLLHEFGHGLGFSTTTNGTTGALFSGFASAYDHFLIDQTQNLLWVNMTDAQRAASAINTRRLSWNGANVTANVPNVLSPGHARTDRDRSRQHRQHLPDRHGGVRSAADRVRPLR